MRSTAFANTLRAKAQQDEQFTQDCRRVVAYAIAKRWCTVPSMDSRQFEEVQRARQRIAYENREGKV